jgi:hypothetical protein
MAEIKTQVRVDEHEFSALFKDLDSRPTKSRAGRLRYLAALGVLVEQGRIPMILPGNVTPMDPCQVVPSQEPSTSDSAAMDKASESLEDNDLEDMLSFGGDEPVQAAQA